MTAPRALYDVVSFGETMLRLTPPPTIRLEDAHSLGIYVAGAESNVLACVSRLGLRCAWLSALPLNPPGRRVDAELRRHGVDTARVVWTGPSTRLGIFYAEEFPSPLGTQVAYDRAASAFALVDPDRVDLAIVESARLLHLTGITPALGQGPRKVFHRLLARAGERGVPVSLDVNYRAKLWSPREAAEGIEEACRAASLLFCTRADAAELWGFTGTPETVLRQMAGRFGTGEDRTYILTLGSDGGAHLRDDRYESAPAFASGGVIRFGSGDAFAAGYLYAHLQVSGDWEPPLLAGNAVAALKRCIAGDIATVTLDEVLAVLRGHSGGRFR